MAHGAARRSRSSPGWRGTTREWLKTAAARQALRRAQRARGRPARVRRAGPTDHDLYDTYLPQFEAAVREGPVASVMRRLQPPRTASPARPARACSRETLRKAVGVCRVRRRRLRRGERRVPTHHAAPSREAGRGGGAPRGDQESRLRVGLRGAGPGARARPRQRGRNLNGRWSGSSPRASGWEC